MRFLLLLLPLAACGPDLPPGTFGEPRDVTFQTRPQLIPLDPILAQSAVPPLAEPAGIALRERIEAVRARAVPDAEVGDLAARGEALRSRAEQLRRFEF